MSDTASSARTIDPASLPEGPDGSTQRLPPPGEGGVPHVSEDQPTVITSRRPMSPADRGDAESTTFEGRLAPGGKLGHFELLEYVGGGGMGRVFRAIDNRLSRVVALKVLPREQAADPETLLRFRNEARSAARLNHGAISQVFYVGEEQGFPFIAFEFVDGVNVRKLVDERGALSLGEAISYTLQVAEALDHAARQRVVHRDIKPSNILITADGKAKLIDLGLARMLAFGDSGSDLTASGVTLGTFDYISPEQARDPRNADIRSDVYSLGCTLFYMLAGRPPFPEGTVLQKLLQHQGDEPPDICDFRPDLPEEVARLLRRMMAKDPRKRFQEPGQLIEALTLLAQQVGLEPVGPGQMTWVVPKEPRMSLVERHLPWMAPIAGLILIVLLLDFLWSPGVERDVPLPPPIVERPETFVESLPEPGEPGPPERPAAVPAESRDSAAEPAVAAETGADGPGSSEGRPAEEGAAPPAGAPPGAGRTPPDGAGEPAVAEEPAGPGEAMASNTLGPEPFSGEASVAEPAPTGVSASGAPSGEPAELSGAPGSTADGPEGEPSPTPAAETATKVVYVDPTGQTEGGYATLAAACQAAGPRAAIELRFTGRRREKPLELTNRTLTVRAGEGYRPVVTFDLSEVEADPFPTRSMVSLVGTTLNLEGVAFEFDVPRELAADHWSLVELTAGSGVSVRRGWLTIANASDQGTAYHPEVSFFRVKSAPGSGMGMDDGETPSPQTTVALADSVLRGEAVVLRCVEPLPVELTWENGLAVTTEALLEADGDGQPAHPGDAVRLRLVQVTAAVGGGLCKLRREPFGPALLPTLIEPTASILLGSEQAPLLEQTGVVDLDRDARRVIYRGDRVFYEGFETFWAFRLPEDDGPDRVVTMTFDSWKDHWGTDELDPHFREVRWLGLPEPARPVHARTPVDYELDRASSDNPALAAGDDGRDAGFDPATLPPPPPAEEPPTPETESDAP